MNETKLNETEDLRGVAREACDGVRLVSGSIEGTTLVSPMSSHLFVFVFFLRYILLMDL